MLRPPASSASASASVGDNRLDPGTIVEYELHSKAILGVLLSEKKGKWVILNQHGTELELPPARLYRLPDRLPSTVGTLAAKTEFLAKLHKESEALGNEVDLEELWSILVGEVRECSTKELTELAFSGNSLLQHLALRRRLAKDQVFFKRGTANFQPRPTEVVEELKHKVAVEEERERKRRELCDALVTRIKNPARAKDIPLPPQVSLIEDLAAEARDADKSKEIIELIDDVFARAGLTPGGKPPTRAFHVLLKAQHFGEDEHLLPRKLGRQIEFSQDVRKASQELLSTYDPSCDITRVDLTALTLFTIDNVDTQDMDDALSLTKIIAPDAEKGAQAGDYEVGIHISDAAAALPYPGTLFDLALTRATSIYCPDRQIPMLPHELSDQSLSLRPNELRGGMSFFIVMSPEGEIRSRRILHSLIRSAAKLSYTDVDEVLFEDEGSSASKASAYATELRELWSLVSAREAARLVAGSLQFTRKDLQPLIHADGTVTLEETNEDTPAHKLVSELMVLANETAALYAAEHSLPLVFRSQEGPDVNPEEQGLDIPEGPARLFYQRGFLKRSTTSSTPLPHSGLGLRAYAQVTSPIRRVIDLVNQHQLSQHLISGAPRFKKEEVELLLASAEAGLDEAFLIQRDRLRYFLLKYLSQEGIREVNAIVVRLDGPKPLAEIEPFFNIQVFGLAGRKPAADSGLRLGDTIRLKVLDCNARADTLVLTVVV